MVVDVVPQVPRHRLLHPRHQIGPDEIENILEEKHDQDENDDSLDRVQWVALDVHDSVHRGVQEPGHRIWATHLIDEVQNGDSVIVLHEGRIRADGEASEVVSRAGVEDIGAAFDELTAGGGS